MKYDINLFIQSNNQIIAIDESLDGLRVIINKDLKKHILLSKYRNIPKYNCHRKFLKSSRKYDYVEKILKNNWIIAKLSARII